MSEFEAQYEGGGSIFTEGASEVSIIFSSSIQFRAADNFVISNWSSGVYSWRIGCSRIHCIFSMASLGRASGSTSVSDHNDRVKRVCLHCRELCSFYITTECMFI